MRCNIPSVSKSQRKLMGWVHACQKGTSKNCPPNIMKVANSIKPSDAEDFARTKHKGLPERKKLKTYKEFQEEKLMESGAQMYQMANITMDDLSQAHQMAVQAGVPVNKYYRIMGKWLTEIESKMGLKNQQSGEEANQWHGQALKALQSILNAAAGGKQQWTMAQQLGNIKRKTAMPQNDPSISV